MLASSDAGETHIATALRLLLIQIVAGLAIGTALAGLADLANRPLGSSQTDAVLVISSILTALLLVAAAVVAG